MTLTTTFVNNTKVAFKLKEGDNGVYKELCILQGLTDPPSTANKKTLQFDARSTYKEYTVRDVTSSRPGRVPSSIKIQISSDFILDNSTIYIEQDPKDPENYVIRGDYRSNTPLLSSVFRLVSKVLSMFRKSK